MHFVATAHTHTPPVWRKMQCAARTQTLYKANNISFSPSPSHTHLLTLILSSLYLPQFMLSMQNLTKGLALNIFGAMVSLWFVAIHFSSSFPLPV